MLFILLFSVFSTHKNFHSTTKKPSRIDVTLNEMFTPLKINDWNPKITPIEKENHLNHPLP